ncbi:MAG: hypothetical protein IJU37_05895 [Desulfovibrio sp.]|nr:hypothetical protein [Desulfovibrio sp.]
MPDRPYHPSHHTDFHHKTGTHSASGSSDRTTPRRWTQAGFLPFRLEVLTPVFIGSGEDLSPLDYVIRKEQGGYVLHLVDTESWLQSMQDKADIRSALDRGDMLTLRQLMAEQLDAGIYSLGRIPMPSPATAEGLLAHIKNPKSLSNAEVQPMPRSPSTMSAFVPGSSLKGAISTPIIDSLDHGELRAAMHTGKAYFDARAYADRMKYLFGNITEHAMQALKVSDIPVPPGGTRIVTANEVRMTPSQKARGTSQKPTGTPKPPCEVLTISNAGGLPLYGRLFMETTTNGPGITLPNAPFISFAALSSLCRNFYAKRFREEMDKFYRLNHLAHVGTALQPILRRIENLNPEQEMLLRVGHYSHVECVTITANAPQGRKGVFGKTRTLADRKLPFGWVVLSFCSEEEYRDGLEKVENAIASATQEHEEHRRARQDEILRTLEEQRKRAEAAALAKAKAEEERLQREREAAEREAAMAHLSPEERAIAEVAMPDATEAQSMNLYAKLDSLEGELQAKAAAALQTCWQRLGKWSGKQLSKKQKEKVAKVRLLLPA